MVLPLVTLFRIPHQLLLNLYQGQSVTINEILLPLQIQPAQLFRGVPALHSYRSCSVFWPVLAALSVGAILLVDVPYTGHFLISFFVKLGYSLFSCKLKNSTGFLVSAQFQSKARVHPRNITTITGTLIVVLEVYCGPLGDALTALGTVLEAWSQVAEPC